MKKTMLLLACLMTMGVAMTTACGQVSQDSSDSQQSSVVQDSFSISAGNFAAAELGESYTVDLSSVKVTDAGGTASSLTVSVKGNEVKDPSGAAMQLENNAFTPAATGNWTVVLYVEGHPEIAEVTATIEVKDTVGPVIEAKGDFSETAKIGDEIAVPEFTVTDYGSLAGELEVTVTDPEGKAVAVSENKFVVEKVGEYRITAKQKDAAGNEGVCNLTVAGEYDVSQVGLSSYDSIGFEEIWDGYITFNKVTKNDLNPEDQFYGDENYSAKVSIVEGKETKNIRLWMDMEEKDWSEYDYVKFYVYNNTNISLRIALCEDNDNNSLMRPNVGVGEWTPVVIPLTEGAKIASNRVSWVERTWQELNNVETLGLYLTTAEDNNWSTGNAFKSGDIWFSAMEGGNYKTTDENVLIPVEEGINATNVARIRMINHYNIVESSEQTAPGEAMSLKLYALRDFPAGDNLVITMNGRYYLQAGYAGDVYMWVYNGGKTAVTINAKTAVTLQPGEGKMITFTASEAEIVININSSSMKTGDALYFGNVYKGAAE